MSSNRNYGQEITQNEWALAWQNFSKLMLTSFIISLLVAMIWFGLFAPQGYMGAIALYSYSWLFCKLPFGCSSNASYNLRNLQPIMAEIGGLLIVCRNITAIGTIAAAFGLNRYFKLKGEELEKDKIIRGSKLLAPGELKEEIAAEHEPNSLDLIVGRESVRIPYELTFQHISMAGVSGTGKTQAINSLLIQLQNQKRQKVIIIDPNGQYYSRFSKPEDKILSLYDKRAEPWDFWHEDAPPEFFAEALIEESPKDKFFAPAGRAMLADLLRANNSNEGLWKDLISATKDLKQRLEGGLSPTLIEGDEQAAGVKGTTILKFGFLRYLNYWSHNKNFFSVVDWATDKEDCSWVYLIFSGRDSSATEPLLRIWFDLATLGVLSRDAGEAEKNEYPHLWLIADELPGLGKLPSLGKLLSQGRKYRSSVVSGYQTAAQIRDIYGRDGAGEILDGFQNKLIYRCSNPDTAKQCSLELGEQDVIEISKNTQFGRLAESDRNSLNQSFKTKPTVLAAEIQGLPNLCCYLKICHHNPSLIHLDYHRYQEKNQATDCEIPTLYLPKCDLPEAELPNEKELIVEENYLADEEEDEYDEDFLNFSRPEIDATNVNAEVNAETNAETEKPEPDYDFDPENFLDL